MKIKDDLLLAIFRARRSCEWCGRPVPRCEPAHIISRGAGGSDIPANLVALGFTNPFEDGCHCHQEQHQGHHPLPRELMLLVAKRYNVEVIDVLREIYHVRRLPKGSVYTCPFTGHRAGAPHLGHRAGEEDNILRPDVAPGRSPGGPSPDLEINEADEWRGF